MDNLELNLENLQRMYNHIESIDERKLDMKFLRESNLVKYERSNHECNSVGCILGHCLILDNWKNVPFMDYGGKLIIDFPKWSNRFLNLDPLDDEEDLIWKFLFADDWSEYDRTNSKEQILARVKYVIEHQTYHPLFIQNYKEIYDILI